MHRRPGRAVHTTGHIIEAAGLAFNPVVGGALAGTFHAISGEVLVVPHTCHIIALISLHAQAQTTWQGSLPPALGALLPQASLLVQCGALVTHYLR